MTSSSSSSSFQFPFSLNATQLYGRALWDPTPTKTIKSQKQLAFALGYPSGWRVERTVERKNKNDETITSTTTTTTTTTTSNDNCSTELIIRDRIHATVMTGKKNDQEIKCTWFHHDAAQKAMLQLEEYGGESAAEDGGGIIQSSHLLPPTPLYAKGDSIQVKYEGKWYDAIITKRKRQGDEFLYSVEYQQEDAEQDEVEESDIRPGQDPSQLAVELGFSNDWKASRKGARYVLTSPTGETFTSKKAAMKFIKQQKDKLKAAAANSTTGQGGGVVDDADDPPWRTEGHEWIGRRLIWGTLHRISGTRKVKIDQVGMIEGYIDETDLDKEGNPGFVSEFTGKPAKLFHVTFPDEPHHPYASHLLNFTDLEEHEIVDNLIEELPNVVKRKHNQQQKQQQQQQEQKQKEGEGEQEGEEQENQEESPESASKKKRAKH